jgi:hypothetical protein
MMDAGEISKLLQQYQQILSSRHQRFSSDSVFGGAKYMFEKALLEEIARVHEPVRADSLQGMYVELASFMPQKDYDLVEQCRRRADQDPAFKQVLDLISVGDHETIQKELEARAIPELVRYYAVYRRVMRESEARRKQALSVQELNTDS